MRTRFSAAALVALLALSLACAKEHEGVTSISNQALADGIRSGKVTFLPGYGAAYEVPEALAEAV